MRTFNMRVLTLAAALVACVLALPVAAQTKDEKAEQKRQKQMQEALQREARPVLLLMDHLHKQASDGSEPAAYVVNPKEDDAAKAFTPATPPVDAKAIGWRTDMLKASDGKVYVPYTVTLPANAVPGGPVSVYVRVVPKGSQPPTGEEGKGAKYPYEDYFTAQPKPDPGGDLRILRAFAVPPGEYEVLLGIRQKPGDAKKDKDDPVRVIAMEQPITLPDYWNGEFTTSSVIVSNQVEQVQGQLSPEMQRERPYLLGQTEFNPSPDGKFKKTDELSVIFQIYNPTLDAGKFDVTVEYNFHQKLAEGEKYFNKTSPQPLTPETMPPTFDVTKTQMLPGGQSVPLASFPAGDYRMEIKITDNLAKKTITRDVMFSVVE